MNYKRLIFLFLIIISQYAFAQTAYWRVGPTYDHLEVMNENLLKVKSGYHYGVVAYDGREIVPCAYSQITNWGEECALLLNGNKLQGIMTDEGKMLPLSDEYMVNLDTPYFSEGLLAVKNENGWGYLDKTGTLRIECQYVEAYPFKFGLAAVARTYKGQKYHIHIKPDGNMSRLGDGYNDDYLVFTSTFTSNSEGTFAIVVNNKDRISKRALDGTKLLDLGTVELFHKELKQLVLKSGEVLNLNDDWSLKSVVMSDGKMIEFGSKSDTPHVNPPDVSSIDSSISDDGKYDLRVMNKLVLLHQFDSVIPLAQNLCAVSLSGKYGILDIYPTGNLSFSFTNPSCEVSHHVPVDMKLHINNISSLFTSYRLDRADITLASGNKVNSIIVDDTICFEYLPPLNGAFTETFNVSYQISGLTYPEQQVTADFAYSPAFRIIWPTGNVSLDSRHNAVFDIYVENRSSIASDECEIIIEGKSYGKYYFKPKQKIQFQVHMEIDIQDEDSITKPVNVIVRENGCPDFKDRRNIVFKRYFINN